MSRRYSPFAVFLSMCVLCFYCLLAPARAQTLGDVDGAGKTATLWRPISADDVSLWTLDWLAADDATDGYVRQAPPPQEPPASWLIHKVYGLDFSPYTYAGQDPNEGTVISESQIASLLAIIAPYTHWVRTFGTAGGLEYVGALAHSLGLKTAIGAYIDGNPTDDAPQIASLIQLANAGAVDVAIVGNEYLLNNSSPQAEATVIAYINQVRQQIPSGIPVTYVDTWNTIQAHPNVVAAVDIVAVNIYPFYEDAPIDEALSQLQSDYQQTVQFAQGKPIWITETGWPSSGNPPSFAPDSLPSPANAAVYFYQAEQWARSANIPLFYFEAFDEPWKANYSDYPSWGIWNDNGAIKPGMFAPFE